MKTRNRLLIALILWATTLGSLHAQTITDSLMRAQIREKVQTNPMRSNSAAVMRDILYRMLDFIQAGGGPGAGDPILTLTTAQLQAFNQEPIPLLYVSDRGTLYEYTNEDQNAPPGSNAILDALGRRYTRTTLTASTQRLIRISWGYDFGGDFDLNDFN